eukprot:99606_1
MGICGTKLQDDHQIDLDEKSSVNSPISRSSGEERVLNLLTFGFIRCCYTSMWIDDYGFSDPLDAVPQVIIDLLMDFYGHFKLHDTWSIRSLHKDLSIRNNTITYCGNHCNYRSAFLSQLNSSGIHIWRFQINNISKNTRHLIGILKVYKNTKFLNGVRVSDGLNLKLLPLTNTEFLTKPYSGYGYYTGKGVRSNPNRPYEFGSDYGVKCKNGDMITMIVNFDNLTLSYRVNGVDHGIAFP